MQRDKEIQYTGDLGFEAESEVPSEKQFGGLDVSPLQAIWQVNPGAEAIDPDDMPKNNK